jgi:hypothetical protein
LTAYLRQEKIEGGSVTGIGAVMNTTLGYFDLHTKEYRQRVFPEDMELVSLTGNITRVDGAPFVHAHAVLSGEDFVAHAGHLFSAEIAVTGELFITPAAVRITRALDQRTGLKLMAEET